MCYEIVKTLVRMLVLLQVCKCSNEADKENKKFQRKDDKEQEFIMREGKAPLKSNSSNVRKNIGVILMATKAGLVF